MTIDFQQVRSQVKDFGEKAVLRLGELNDKRVLAQKLLSLNANNPEPILQRVERITRQFDPNLRCAVPAAELTHTPEALDFHAPLPALPQAATLIAADGSQINPDRHEQVNFGLINVGAILVRLGLPDPPTLTVKSDLIYDEALYTPYGIISEAQVALIRDLNERQVLVRLAEAAEPPVITFTDGPMELWGSRDTRESKEYEHSLKQYLGVLRELHEFWGCDCRLRGQAIC